MTDDDGYVSPRRSPRLSPAAPLDAAAAGRSSPAAPVAQPVLSPVARARRAAGAPVTPQEDSFIPTSTETVTCTRIRFGRDESGPHRHHPSDSFHNRVKDPSFSVKSDGNETRVEMKVFAPITGCPIVRPVGLFTEPGDHNSAGHTSAVASRSSWHPSFARVAK